MNKKEPRILLWDIENAHNAVLAFDLFQKQPLGPDNIIEERYIISISWKWLGEKKVHSISVADDGARFAANPHDDYPVLAKMIEVFEEADAVVHHYGDKHDIPMVNARLAFHKLPPLPPIIKIDTYKIAKKHFRFNSNRLDYLGKFLGFGGKKKTEPGLWKRCFFGDKKAVNEMVEYNKGDVTLLEKVFLCLRPFAGVQVNQQLFRDKADICENCGSNHLHYRGYRYTRTRKYRRFQCNACHTWGASRKNEPVIMEEV